MTLMFALARASEVNDDAVAHVVVGGTRIAHAVTSVRAKRDAGLIKQAYDYSCGSAALATLLTYGIGHKTDEATVLRAVFDGVSDEEKATLFKKGLSLLDLQRVTRSFGHRAQGFRIAPDQLGKLSRPVIVYVRPRGYEHFAVLKGIRGGRVFLADPSLGNIRMPLYRFIEMWALENGKGVIFAVEPGDRQWPADTPLRPPVLGDPPLEQLSARELFDVGKTYPLALPAIQNP